MHALYQSTIMRQTVGAGIGAGEFDKLKAELETYEKKKESHVFKKQKTGHGYVGNPLVYK